MTRSWRRCLFTGLLLALGGCSSCSQPQPPDNYTVERMADPYDKIPARGAVSDLERAIAVVDYVGEQLHCDRVPGRIIRLHADETWMKGLVLLLADGKDASIQLAWENLLSIVTTDRTVPSDIKARVRQAEGRVDDYVNTKASPDLVRRERLAELTWTLYQLAPLTPDAGTK